MSIPEWIKDLIMPIITDLQADELLQKCLHGETQNNNEGLNSIIWSWVCKSMFVSKPIIEMGTYSAILHFNDGTNGTLQVLGYCNMSGKITRPPTSPRTLLGLPSQPHPSLLNYDVFMFPIPNLSRNYCSVVSKYMESFPSSLLWVRRSIEEVYLSTPPGLDPSPFLTPPPPPHLLFEPRVLFFNFIL